MRQILRKLFAQEKAGNIFGNLLHEIHQTIYFLFWANEITKKVYNNKLNSIQWLCKIDTIFMNLNNSKKSDLIELNLILKIK